MENKKQMAAQEDNQQQHQQQQAPQRQKNPIDELGKVGGFGFVETVIDGIANMNPTRKARKEIFINDQNKETERRDLLKRINLWVNLLENNKSVEELSLIHI